jgi:pimeloyl-ACP methyl ester carboxylesterase
MTTFLLIPGAWMGAWAWAAVTDGLRTLGHRAIPATLTGLEHPDDDVSGVSLATHVEDVAELVVAHRGDRVVLVAHSYAGMVAGQVATRATAPVAHTVFIQALLPEDGRSMLDVSDLDPRHERDLIARHGGRWPAPLGAELRHDPDLSDDQIDELLARFIGHPGRTITEPAELQRPLSTIRATYVGSMAPAGVLAPLRRAPTWRLRPLESGHWPMVTMPGHLAAIVAEAAAPAA